MSALPLPAEIKVHPLGRGTRFELPPRPVGAARWVGLAPILFGLLFAGGAVAWMILTGVFSSRGKNGGVAGALFSLFGIPFILAGIAIIRTGCLIIAGRTEIETRDGRLSVCERAGPFRKRTTLPLVQVRRFAVNARAVILVEDGQLKLGEQTLFGTKTFRWPRQELDTVQVGPSGMSVNDVPVLELQILPREGEKAGFSSGRDVEELRWMATQLRQALRLGTDDVTPGP